MEEEEAAAAADIIPRLLGRPEYQAIVRHLRARGRHDRHGFPPRPPPEYWEFYQETAAHREFPGIFPTLFRIIKIATQLLVLLSISSVTYLLFYHSIMPSHFDETLYFDYTRAYNPTMHMRHPKRIRKGTECTSPWAAVDLFAKKSAWDARYVDVEPLPRIASGRRLVPNQAYYVETRIELPQSTVNHQVGMFGVVVELRATNGTLLAVSRRSTRIPHESPWIRTLANALCVVPLLLGAWDESSMVILPSYRHFVESHEMPLQHVVIRIEAQARQSTSLSMLPEIVGGSIRIGKELNFFQELIKVWFYTCFMIGTSVFAMFYLLQLQILLMIWDSVRRRFHSSSVSDDFEFDIELDFEDAGLFPDDAFPMDIGSTHRQSGVTQEYRSRSASASSWEDLNGVTQTTVDESSFATPPQPDDISI